MRKDPTEFRKRFQQWRQGVPAYKDGKPIDEEDTRSDTTRQGYHEGDVPYGAGNGPAGEGPLSIMDALAKGTAVVPRDKVLIGEPPAVGLRNPGMFNSSFLARTFKSKGVGRAPMFMTEEIKRNTFNLKAALSTYDGKGSSLLTKQAKSWIEHNKGKVDLSLFSAEEINKLVKMNRRDLANANRDFVLVDRHPQVGDVTFDVMHNNNSVADMIGRVHNGNISPEMIESYSKQGGMSRRLYDAAIQSGEQLGYSGVKSGEHLISAPKTWKTWEHYPDRELLGNYGYHLNRMMVKPDRDGRMVHSMEEAKKAAAVNKNFTYDEGPVYLLKKESLFVPVKDKDVFDASILNSDGTFARDWNSKDITKAMLPFAVGGGLWGSKEHKNGKDLPRFADGEDIIQNGVNLKSNPTNATINNDGTFTDDYTKALEQGLTVTGKRPYEYRSAYDPNVIRNFTDWLPGIGDIGQGLDAYNAFKNQDYLLASVLGGAILLPNVIERVAKPIMRAGLKYAPDFTKNLYDIVGLYKTPKDNPRLRKYANDVSDLLSSPLFEQRVANAKEIPNPVDLELKNIASTPMRFAHSDRIWTRPQVQMSTGFGDIQFKSPIPIRYGSKVNGEFDPVLNQVTIRRAGRDPHDIKITAYHETSHASEKGMPENGFIHRQWDLGLVPNTTAISTLGRATEKRARGIATLTDAYKNNVNINDAASLSNFIFDPNYKNVGLSLLLTMYDKPNGTLLDVMLNGYKNGKDIYIKPSHRGRLTALKKRTGKSEAELYKTGGPAVRKMITFARNARKWKH